MGFWDWLKGVARKLINRREIESAAGVLTAISDEMSAAISLWAEMYSNHPPWKGEKVHTLNLPAVIASKIAKLATIEAECSITGSTRADWLMEQLAPVWNDIRNLTELAAAKGGLVFKPYLGGGRIAVDCIQADRFFPTGFDSNGNVTGGVFLAQFIRGKKTYTRIERHEFSGNTHTITNTAYRSNLPGALGSPCPLSEVPEWENIVPQARFPGLKAPLFVYWKMPFANNIVPGSPLGVSIYSRAAETIEQLDRQYSRTLWEYEGGELAVHASADLFRHKPEGGPLDVELPQGNDRLYRIIDGASNEQGFFEVYAPAFRDAALLNGFNALLRQIEQQCGLAFGTLSDPQSVDKTATEVIQSKQESYSTVADIQKSLETALRRLIESVDALATLCHLAPAGSYEAAFTWDDSIIVDKEAKRQQFWQYVTAGKFPFWRFLMDFEGYTEEEAKALSLETDISNPYGFREGG